MMERKEQHKGKIYYCEDKEVLSHLTRSDGALVTYQPTDSPCVGLDCDETGRAIETELLFGAWYLARNGFRRVDWGGQAVAYRESALRIFLFIHQPNNDLRAQFQAADQYLKNLKKYTLQVKYERDYPLPEAPVIMEFFDMEKSDCMEWPTYLTRKCEFITLWPVHDSGFGWHFIVINGISKMKEDYLIKLCRQFHCQLIEARHYNLPRW